MKLSTLLMMIAYVLASFILVPFLTFAVAVNTSHLGHNTASTLALATTVVSVVVMLYIGSKIPIKVQNRPL